MKNNLTTHERDKIVNKYLLLLCICIPPALFGSLLRIKDLGWQPFMLIHIFAAVLHFAVTYFRKQLHFHVKSIYLIAAFTVLGYTALLNWGVIGDAVAIFVLVILMTSLFYGTIYSSFVAGAIALSYLYIGYLVINRIVILNDLASQHNYQYTSWIEAFTTVIFIYMITLMVPYQFIKSLSKKTHYVETMSARLHNALEELKEKSRERKQLLHILCHDLSNHFGAIYSILDMRDEEPEVLNEMADHMEMSVQCGRDVINMIRDLLAIEEGKKEMKIECLNLKQLVGESYRAIDYKFFEKNIELVREIPDDIFINVERVSFLNSILNNLLTNAVKFSFPDSKIFIRASRDSSLVTVVVEDKGIGMPDQLQIDIFRIDKVTTRRGTNGEIGTGFGMPIVKKFVELFGGTILVNSHVKTINEPTSGTMFTMTFPIEISTESDSGEE